ncbi:hypothetical protein CXB51_033548 [Gossypium anomalum]|uniref:CCHC-type domain-containing protein n=1 Tax=Gossypium anomalum TaxID=47600 RepID=A0A8J5Y186_9ROSI|nr:hypothetical protein CXB51_033548 [Gossypium anomalum]
MAWIRLPGLPGYLYKRKIIEAIGSLIGSVVKLDLQTDNRTRGRFARLAVFINLDEPLVSQVLVKGVVQRVEYEALPTVCFSCGKYGHVKELCPLETMDSAQVSSVEATVESSRDAAGVGGGEKRLNYGPWMLVERKSRRGQRDSRVNMVGAELGVNLGVLSGEKTAVKGAEFERSFKARVVLKGTWVLSKKWAVGIKLVLGLLWDKGASNLKALGKRPVGSNGSSQIGKDLGNNLIVSNNISFAPPVGTAQDNGIDARRVGLANGELVGPMDLCIGSVGPLAPEPNSSGLDGSFPKEKKSELDGQYFSGTSSNGILGNNSVGVQSGSSKVTGNKSIHINPMFDSPSETVVKLDANLLNPNHHSAVIINDQNVSKTVKGNKKIFLVNTNKYFSVSRERGPEIKMGSGRGGASLNRTFKEKGGRLKNVKISRIPLTEAMNSIANLINAQVGSGAEEIGGSAERQHAGCAGLKFSRIFWEYNREHEPDLIGLLETRVSGVKANSIIAKLGFEYSHRVEAVGFSGGIWIGWKGTISVDILGNHSQFILLRNSRNSYRKPVLVSFVYGSPNSQKRKQLWEALKCIVPMDGTPWLAIGDFNIILSSYEKIRGRVIGKRCALFSDFIDTLGLHDLGFSGPNFTWNRGRVFERLDRAICNNAWSLKFLSLRLVHLQKLKSDHRPLLLSLLPHEQFSTGRPFHFLAGWVKHPGFSGFVKKNWEFQENLSSTQATFTDQVKSWNKDVFGHIIHQKNLLKKRLANVQKVVDRRSSSYLDQVEVEIREELEEVLYHEELLWRQKARCDWLVFGYEDEIHFLSRLVTDEEIKKALFDMAPLKALGSDGFYAFFYQS